MRGLSLVWACALAAGCSALVNPDETRLGDDVDAGPGPINPRDAGPGADAGARDAAPPPFDAGCAPGCVGDDLVGCGVPPVTCERGCADSPAPHCREMVPSNVSADLWPQSGVDLDIEAELRASFDTTACRASMAESELVAQSDGSMVCVLRVNRLRVRAGAYLRPYGENPLIVMATEEVIIEEGAYVDLSSIGDGTTTGFTQPRGAGGGLGGTPARDAEGASPGFPGGTANLRDDGGGGGGGLCGAGGAGGVGGSTVAANGGSAVETNLLIPLRGGSGGGVGPARGTPDNAGPGGAGGGGLQLSARGRIQVDGVIQVAGGGGFGGQNLDGNWGAGGGGGSGGGILLEAPDVRIGATAQLVVSGGGGGGGSSTGRVGGNGQDGRYAFDAQASGGFSGGMTFGAEGGRGAALTVNDGERGGDNTHTDANGGGGGGGVGCLVIRTLDGQLPPMTADRTSARTPEVIHSASILLQ